MLAAMLALGVVAGAGPAAPEAPRKRYSALSTTDLDELAGVLRARVATLHLTVKPRQDMLVDPVRVVFGVVVDGRTVATVAQLCADADTIRVAGPTGALEAKVALLDLERRVALVRTNAPVASIGLEVSPPLPESKREENADVFALVNTDVGAGVVQGVIAQVGRAPEYEGHPRTTLDLTFGMPVFDAYGRWVGYARTLAWDRDQRMLIPPDKVRLARSSTVSAEPASAPEKEKRPWWAR